LDVPSQHYQFRMIQQSRSEPVVYASLGLEALSHRLQGVATCDILDLGPVRSANIEFWSRFNPFIYVADLRSSLPLPVSTAGDSEDPDLVEPDWSLLLTLPEGRSFDVILAWDLLNYLELPFVSSLIRYLKRFCRPGAVLFSLIFDQKQMPEEITAYRIIDESHLAYEYGSSIMRTCPRHQPRAMAGVMSQFQASNSYRLRNGIVEFLFVYEGEPRVS
jgi:hypothetical protein